MTEAGPRHNVNARPTGETPFKVTAAIRSYLDRHRSELLGMLAEPSSAGIELARRHSKIMDGLLTTFFPAALATVDQTKKQPLVLLAAVGGYGRQVLGLKSDLDVRLLTTESPENVRPLAEALLYPLWDAGLSIGHQVMTTSEALAAAKYDLPTATALLDLRPIAGDESLGRDLEERAFAGVFGEESCPLHAPPRRSKPPSGTAASAARSICSSPT